MLNPGIKLTVILFFLLQINSIQSQIQKGELRKDKTITTEIVPGEKHQYKVKLKKDQFAFIKLMQLGVDVIITTYDTSGEKIEDFDSPNGKNGPELITLFSSNKGEYILEVRPFDKDDPTP